MNTLKNQISELHTVKTWGIRHALSEVGDSDKDGTRGDKMWEERAESVQSSRNEDVPHRNMRQDPADCKQKESEKARLLRPLHHHIDIAACLLRPISCGRVALHISGGDVEAGSNVDGHEFADGNIDRGVSWQRNHRADTAGQQVGIEGV